LTASVRRPARVDRPGASLSPLPWLAQALAILLLVLGRSALGFGMRCMHGAVRLSGWSVK
jgi:hypothetical protein